MIEFPFNPDIVLACSMVHVLTEEEREVLKKKPNNNSLNINGKIINNLIFSLNTTFEDINRFSKIYCFMRFFSCFLLDLSKKKLNLI